MLDFEKVLEVATQNIDLLYPPDKRHKGIICPLCGNGQGKDGDGVSFVSSGSPVLKCFRCQFSGDVISMTAKARNISYQEAAEILAEKLGINNENYKYDPKRRIERFDVPKFSPVVNAVQEEQVDQTEYFKDVEKHLSNTAYPATRGLSLNTCRHFHLGFDAHWRHPKTSENVPVSPRLIIPTSKFSYLARDTRKNLTDNQKRYSKQKFGSVSIFNIESIEYEYTFITEGEIDAMSFYELCHANAVALGSVSNIQKLVDHLKVMGEKKPKRLIAALDNDEAGREGNLKLRQALEKIGIHVLIADFIYKDLEHNVDYKDANEILVKNSDAFADNVALIWRLSDKAYESDKLAGQLIDETDTAKTAESYLDEELANMIKESEFTAENLQFMFEDEQFSPKELEQMLSKDNPQPVGLNRVKKDEPLYPGGIFSYSFDVSKHPPTVYRNNSNFLSGQQVKYAMERSLVEIDTIELKKSKDLLLSFVEFNFKTIYTPEVIWALSYCLVSRDDSYTEFEANCEKHGINIEGFHPFVFEYADKFKMIMNQKYWASEKMKLSDEEKEALIASSSLLTNFNKETAHAKKFSTSAQEVESSLDENPVESVEPPSSLPEEEKISLVESVPSPDFAKQLPVAESESVPVSIEISDTATAVSTELSELEKSKNLLGSIIKFDNKTIFSSETLQAAAYCKVYAPLDLITFLERCRENKIKLSLLRGYIRQLAKPISKIKRCNDKQKELARIAEENTRKMEEFNTVRYNNSVQMSALLKQPQSPERDRKLIEFVQKSLERDHTGKVKSSSVANFELALNFDPLICGCVGYDAFLQKIVARRKLPWTDSLSSQTIWTNYDDAGLQNYLNRTYELNNERIFFNVISEYAHKNFFHPVQDYLNNLPKWDGITRVVEYFIENLEIEDNRYSREVIKSWMLAAVARVFHPGCKWDYILVIKGKQSVGKSIVFSKLAGKWFNDSVESIGGQESLKNLLGSWIIELREMQVAKKADNEIIKSILSGQTDKFQIQYGKRTENFFMQCVFVATTNDEEFLKNHTDNQRFLVLVSKAKNDKFRERLSKFGTEYIDQIWAEVFHYYNQLFSTDEAFDSSKLLPDNDIWEMAREIREDYAKELV